MRTSTRLLVVSHTPHHRDRGSIVAFEPTVRELEQLATLVDELVHVAPLHDTPAPTGYRSYDASNIRHVPVAAAGGDSVSAKVAVLTRLPDWARIIVREARRADAIHVRAPAAIALVAIVVLTVVRSPRPRWFKYAGNWSPRQREPLSYGVTRWLLRHRVAGGTVTVNGAWPGQPAHIAAFDNPCLTTRELGVAQRAASSKPQRPPLRALFVGRIEVPKGATRAIDAVRAARALGVDVELDLAGDGELLQSLADATSAEPWVRLHGPLSRRSLEDLYAAAHVLLLPTTASEGFPKVVAEAMAHGAVPLTGDVSSIPQVLRSIGAGVVAPGDDVERFARELERYAAGHDVWEVESATGAAAAARFTYEAHLRRVTALFAAQGLELVAPPLDRD